MDDSLGMAGGQRVGNLDAHVEHLLDIHGLAVHEIAKALAFELLHDDVGLAVEVADIVDGADVGMIQLRGDARLTQEALQRLVIVEQVVRDELQRDAAAKASVFRLVYHPHSTATQLAQNVIVGNGLADHVDGPDHVDLMLGPRSVAVNQSRGAPIAYAASPCPRPGLTAWSTEWD